MLLKMCKNCCSVPRLLAGVVASASLLYGIFKHCLHGSKEKRKYCTVGILSSD